VKDDNVDAIMIIYEAFKEIHFDFRKMLKNIDNLGKKPLVLSCIQLENKLADELVKKVEEFNIPIYIDDIHATMRSLKLYYERWNQAAHKETT
jgi:hypothetical protein